MQGPDSLEFVNVPASSLPAATATLAEHDISSAPARPSTMMFEETFRNSAHPTVAIFHVLFKGLALFFYVFANMISDNFVFVFVLIVLCLAFDFWTVKNVSGRLLVGLRWWSSVRDDGQTEWVFETVNNKADVNKADSSIFWTALYVYPTIWGFLFFFGLIRLKFSWLLICGTALALSVTNVIGYYKCSGEQKTRVANLMQSGTATMVGGLMGGMGGRMMSMFAPADGGGNYQAQPQTEV